MGTTPGIASKRCLFAPPVRGKRVEQAHRIRMKRLGENLPRVRALDHLAGVHDRDIVGLLGDHAEIMGDQQQSHADLLLQLFHQIEDLRLNRHVERGGRLIGDQERRIARQRHGDHNPLAHAAAQLMGIGIDAGFRIGDLHQPEHFDGFRSSRLLVQPLVQLDRFADLIADGKNRIERGHRLLEDHRDLVASDLAHLLVTELEQILAAVDDLAADNFPRRRRDQPHDRQRSDALAAAGLADQPKSLALVDLEANAVDGAYFAFRCEERSLEVFDLE